MEEKTLTLDLDAELMEDLEAYVSEHNTSLRELVTGYLRSLVAAEQPWPEKTPILRRLSGVLPSSVSEGAHRDYLVDKYEP